jgi:hypothetical protein
MTMNGNDAFRELRNVRGADWVRAMQQHYNDTGTYRIEDLRRLLGDPMRGVSLRPDFASPQNTLPKEPRECS